MEEVIKIFQQLQSTTKKTEKEKIIKTNQNNELFLECLKFLLDGNIVTGISKKKLEKKVPLVSGLLANWITCMVYLKKNNTGKDTDISYMQQFINSQPEEYREFYSQMITKKLKLGCDYKTVNKSLGYKLINVWEVQQAYSLCNYPLKSKNEWFSLSQKLNGNHCSFYLGKLISRQGKEFHGLQHIIDDIHRLGNGIDAMFFDGELIRKNTDGLSDEENFRIGTGIINSDSPKKEEIEYVIYEMMPVDEFDTGESKLKYKKRKQQLLNLKDKIANYGLKHIRIVDYFYEGTDQAEIQKWLDYADIHDMEGLMLNKDTTYKCKRNQGILKVKTFYSMDLPITGFKAGTGMNNSNTLGTIIVDYKGNTVGVSGFNDKLADEIWNNQSKYLGKLIEVKYKTITKDKKTGLESLQFPKFVRIRNDKDCVSYD